MRSRTSLATALLLMVMGTGRANGSHIPGTCDTGIPADEALGVSWFPRGDVFCSLIADPKSDGSFASYVRGTSSSAFGTDLASIGIGDRFDLWRVNGPRLGEGVQLGVSGNVYAQFDLDSPSDDLINADYMIGLPLTLRFGPISSRVRPYHQSSHLGDEFVLRPGVERENFSFESIEGIASIDLVALRLYGGGEYVFDRTPGNRVSHVVHGGVELRQANTHAAEKTRSRVRLVAALDLKSAQELDWDIAWSARAGLELGRDPGATHRSRRLSLLGEYYDGPSPYGQFFRDEVRYYGVGIHLGP